ncbi:SpoIIE family protein phosphatase [Aminobacter sp. AP02]|uniref:SpoIIE family protein phosphatase n=1 Tax=Aminobacter sp. AP02 TaxID=2135737 RepID=UPI000D6BDB39|nr:SpoIIE family protein phosphatase [Aminobacter sp. AP02]PWK66450.1 sigma-B regulation protein RsbU (phosphoserine phosphatase) [Aminobacter sp. AP02]
MSTVDNGTSRFGLRSFRAKFVLVVGGAVLVDLLISGGLALWNVNRLSRDATQQVGLGLTKATGEYLNNYIETTAERTDLLIDRVHTEVDILAGSTQALIDHPQVQSAVGEAIKRDQSFTTRLTYNPSSDWWQNEAGESSAVTVWGYLLNATRNLPPDVERIVRDSTAFNIFGPAVQSTGTRKLQVYFIGPKSAPILRSTPYTNQGVTFDRVYPGHNDTNWWDFFFPQLYEDWQAWLKDPGSKPVDEEITTLSPYKDGVTGKIIVSFFRPVWNKERTDLAGVVGADLTLDQMADIVQSVRIAETGFAFLSMSNGNVLAVTPEGEKTLGIGNSSPSVFDRSLRRSTQSAISALPLDQNDDGVIQTISLDNNGEKLNYIVVLKKLRPTNMWSAGPIIKETMTVGIVVPESEIYATLIAAQESISQATNRILLYQLAAIGVALMIVFAAVFGLSKRITAGLSALAAAARKLQSKDYTVRVDIPTKDEVGELGVAFNRMAEEISYHTENLEQLVEDRTQDLENANQKISSLNEKLRSENVRLGAELDVARQIQLMVLPKDRELATIPGVEIAAYMRPADEVGGDYYDVLLDGQKLKVGIGDVTGHGLESGVLMLMVQSVARALQETGEDDPLQFLDRLNRAIFKNLERTNSDKHLSLAFLDYENGKLTLSGQHEEVVVVRAEGVERIDTIDLGFPIGLEKDISPFVATRNVAFATGDVVVLHTDGVTEAEGAKGDLFGLDRLVESARQRHGASAEEIKDGIVADLMAHIGTSKIHDDITLVVMRHR